MFRTIALKCLFCLPVILVTALVTAQSQFQGDPVRGETIRAQKEKLSQHQKKWSSDLVQLLDEHGLPPGRSREEHVGGMRRLRNLVLGEEAGDLKSKIEGGRVHVSIRLEQGTRPELITPLLDQFKGYVASHDLVFGWVRTKDLDLLSSLEQVKGVSTVLPPVTRTGSVVTEGDLIHRSANVRSTFGEDGAGIRIGIISDGVDSVYEAQASGDLPPTGGGLTILSNRVGGDEGTAMLEIVHDIVPGAELYFHDCGNNRAEFTTAITALKNAGCKIICDDIGWLLEPFFEDGSVATHVKNLVQANSVLYVSAAGNQGSDHYQGTFYPLSSTDMHDFSHGVSAYTDLYVHLEPGQEVVVVLQWDDKFGQSANDYDLYLCPLTDLTTPVAWSIAGQDGNGDPLEYYIYTSNVSRDYAIRVNRYSGAVREIEAYIYTTGDIYTNNLRSGDSIFGHPAVPGVLAAGAIAAGDPGNDTIEHFSSQGPVTISWPASESRPKPDIIGIDGVSVTGAGWFPTRFYGTSAAAPHIAALAGQLWARTPSLTPADIRTRLQAAAVDLGSPGFDNIFGFGRADAWNASPDTRSATGYTILGTDGGVFAFGGAQFYGSLPAIGLVPNAPLRNLTLTTSEQGYYMMGLDGGVFCFGDAQFLGSLPGLGISNQTIDLEAVPGGQGYYLLGPDGGVFAFGTAQFYGSLPGVGVVNTALDMEVTPSGQGYWILGIDGGIFAFGDGAFYGSLPSLGVVPVAPLKRIKSTPDGRGYYLLGGDGGVFAFGNANFYGSLPALGVVNQAVDLEITPNNQGYYMLGLDGGIFSFGDAGFFGSLPGIGLVTTTLDMEVKTNR